MVIDGYPPRLFDCAAWCQGYLMRFDLPTCYGFSYNQNTGVCILYQQFDQDIGVVGDSPGFTFYRRIFQCGKQASRFLFLLLFSSCENRGVNPVGAGGQGPTLPFGGSQKDGERGS